MNYWVYLFYIIVLISFILGITSNAQLAGLKTSTTANTASITALQGSLTTVQTATSSRAATTSLTTSTTSETVTFGSDITSASCNASYTAYSSTESRSRYSLTVVPVKGGVYSTVTFPMYVGYLSSVASCTVTGIFGQSGSNTADITGLTTPLIDVTNQKISLTFLSNDTSSHIINLDTILR